MRGPLCLPLEKDPLLAERIPGLSRADFADLPPLAPYGVRGEAPAGAPLRLSLSRGLRSWPVVDASGTRIASIHGLLLEGWLGDGLAVVDGTVRVDRAIATADEFERHVLRGLNGSFVVEMLGDALPHRLYLDCGGSVPIVFCAETRRLGGSADQILDDAEYQHRFLHDRYQRLVAGEGTSGWIPGTLTAHRGVSRLLLNHYLDLDDFSQHRFWPSAELLEAPELPMEAAAAIVARQLRGLAAAAAEQFQVTVALTAGMDSRLVLAAFNGHWERIEAMTFGGDTVAYDQAVAPALCRMTGTPHRLVSVARAGEAETARWDRMVGHAVREVNRELHPSLRLVDGDMIATGMYGESGRGYHYMRDWASIDSKAADAADLLARLKQPRNADLLADLQSWLVPIAHLPRSTVLDLCYLELRMGSWGVGQLPVQNALHLPLMPFTQWPVQEAFLKVGIADRATKRLLSRVGEMLWPEGMRVPINRFGDWRDQFGPLLKLARRDSLATIRRFLRAKRAG